MEKTSALNADQLNKCKACGLCCKSIGFPLDPKHDHPMVTEFYEARGLEVLVATGGNKMLWMRDHKCPHLVEGQGCKIYLRRPYVCQQYDGRIDPFINCPLKEE